MRFKHAVFEHALRTFFSRKKSIQIGSGSMQYLLGSQGAAGMPAHAIRHNSNCHSLEARMRKNGDTILLFLAVPLVGCGTRINGQRHEHSPWCWYSDGGKLAVTLQYNISKLR
jgi:hypothetical protein